MEKILTKLKKVEVSWYLGRKICKAPKSWWENLFHEKICLLEGLFFQLLVFVKDQVVWLDIIK